MNLFLIFGNILQRIMYKINDLLITEAENYLSALMSEKLPESILFHNFHHALQVKKYAETISGHAALTAEDLDILRICALFHDAGYVSSYENHIEESIKIASAFLSEHDIDRQTIDHISGIIVANKFPQQPGDKIAEVLCDADMMFIASESGFEQFDLLYDETAMQSPDHARRSAFEKGYIAFLAEHAYFTEYGKTILQPAKEAFSRRLSERLKRRKQIENKKEIREKNNISYSRGVETLFRLTARNQINLNSIADNKSNILISVNAIIISIIITMLAGNIGNMSQNILPILVFLIMCLATIIIAILSTRPILVTKKFTEEDIRQKNVDLIFFGNYVKMEYDDYLKGIKEMIRDDEHLYSILIKNQYSLGIILSKKFRLVKIAYNVFMIGIITTVVVFLLNYFLINNMS